MANVLLTSSAFNVGDRLKNPLLDIVGARAALAAEGHTLRVRITDDGSTDLTGYALDAFAADKEWLEVHHNPTNLGNAQSTLGNYRWALERAVRGSIIATFDADGEHNAMALARHVRGLRNQRTYHGYIGTIIYPQHRPSWVDLNMMRFLGALQAEVMGLKKPCYIQSGGWQVHKYSPRLVHIVLDVIPEFIEWHGSEYGPLPRWGFHGLFDHLLAAHGIKLDALYLECFGDAPNRSTEKLELQAKAALGLLDAVKRYMGHVHFCEWAA